MGNDSLDIYNTTGADIVILAGTVPANGYLSIPAAGAVACAKDPILAVQVVLGSLGVSSYGLDLATMSADWLRRIALGVLVYS